MKEVKTKPQKDALSRIVDPFMCLAVARHVCRANKLVMLHPDIKILEISHVFCLLPQPTLHDPSYETE